MSTIATVNALELTLAEFIAARKPELKAQLEEAGLGWLGDDEETSDLEIKLEWVSINDKFALAEIRSEIPSAQALKSVQALGYASWGEYRNARPIASGVR